MRPLVSIALCTYNGAKYLREQLESLLGQDWDPLEIVVVDDGSTDETLEILREFAGRDSRIRVYVNEQNLGFLANFQKAIELTQGELIAPCDQDDWWSPTKVSRLATMIGDKDLAYCDSVLVDETGATLDMNVSDLVEMYSGNDPAAFVFSNCISGHALLVKRALILESLPFPQGFFHDWWLAFTATSRNGIVYVPEALVRYRQHRGAQTDLSRSSGSRKNRKTRFEEIARTRQWITCLAGFKSLQQHYFQALMREWARWENSYGCLGLAKLLFERKDSLYFIHKRSGWRKILRIVHSVIGLKAKQLLLPYRYRSGQ